MARNCVLYFIWFLVNVGQKSSSQSSTAWSARKCNTSKGTNSSSTFFLSGCSDWCHNDFSVLVVYAQSVLTMHAHVHGNACRGMSSHALAHWHRAKNYAWLVAMNSFASWFHTFGQANFARAVASLSKAQAKKVARFLPNPEKHWGPKPRAGRQITSKHISLLGAEAVNGHLSLEDGEEPDAKRQKTEDTTQKTEDATPSSWNKYLSQYFFSLFFSLHLSCSTARFSLQSPTCIWKFCLILYWGGEEPVSNSLEGAILK